MFMSASIELKFHFWPKTQDDVIYKPPVLSRCTCASWSKDNSYLTYLSEKSKPEILSLKDPRNIKLVHTITALNDVSAIRFQRTTKRCIAVGTSNGQVIMYDTKTKTINKLFGNVPSGVKYIDFNSCDEHLAVACQNGNAVLYDTTDGNVSGNYIISESSEPTCLRFHPTSPSILAASSQEGIVMVWDTSSANKIFTAQMHTAPICGLAFGKQNTDLIITVGDDSKFCVYDIKAKECIFRSNMQHSLSAVDINSDGSMVGIGSEDGMVYLFDVRNYLKPVVSWKAHETRVTKILFPRSVKDPLQFVETSNSELIARTTSETKLNKDIFCCEEVDDSDTKVSISSKKSFDRVDIENMYLKKVKEEVISSIQRNSQEMNQQLQSHMSNLQTFIKNEFHKMDAQMYDKWELLNLASLAPNKEGEGVTYAASMQSTNEDRPLVLE